MTQTISLVRTYPILMGISPCQSLRHGTACRSALAAGHRASPAALDAIP
jgi:hypothetical protein